MALSLVYRMLRPKLTYSDQPFLDLRRAHKSFIRPYNSNSARDPPTKLLPFCPSHLLFRPLKWGPLFPGGAGGVCVTLRQCEPKRLRSIYTEQEHWFDINGLKERAPQGHKRRHQYSIHDGSLGLGNLLESFKLPWVPQR